MRTVLVLIFCFIGIVANAQAALLTPQQMKEDLTYLNKYLRKWHPSYYDYTKKELMDAFYNRLKDSCTTPTMPSAFRATVYRAVDKVGCGHTGVSGFKGQDTAKSKPILPLTVWVIKDKLFIKSLLKKDSLLNIGDEIVEINGQKASHLIAQTAELAMTDGFNKTHKTYSLEYNFPIFHFFLYGSSPNYALTIKNKLGDTSLINLKSDTLKDQPKSRKILKDSSNCIIKGDKITLYKTDFDTSTMIVDIKSFEGSKQGKTFKEIFRHLRTHKIKNLVVDLRNNGGGSVFTGNHFLAYFLDAPIAPLVISRKPNLTFMNPKFRARFIERITPVLFTLNPLQYPSKNGWNHCFFFFKKYRNHFDGKVYVLTNGGTFSMASYAASYLKHKKQAIIVGEETGGSEYGSRGMSSGSIKLPNSGIKVFLNIYQLTHLLNIEDKGHGVIPEHPISYSIEDKLNNKDLEIETIKSLIKK